ncbi:MAG: 50S ribosomal protein L22 [Actinobacteria bacterium]|nr:MAG: 50S ribosomal protein L22 [Actinomycetota bacterium]
MKTNEREGTRAVLRYCRMSAYKVRAVLDLIRGQDVARAADILRICERQAADVVGKVLASAVANAENNDQLDPEELYVSACFADEGMTIKRWRPRARGRATRIRKRTSHITIIVSRLSEDRLRRLRARQAADASSRRARRVAGGRRAAAEQAVARGRRTRRQAPDAAETAAEATAAAEDEAPEVQAPAEMADATQAVQAEETAAAEDAAPEEQALDEEQAAAEEQATAAEHAPAETPDTTQAGRPEPGTEKKGE